MAPRARSAELAAASAKLADEDRPCRHGRHYGISVTARDGKKATVTWQIDTHRAECLPYVLRDIAARLRLDHPDQVLEVMSSWTRDQLRDHLSQYSSQELRPPAMFPRGT